MMASPTDPTGERSRGLNFSTRGQMISTLKKYPEYFIAYSEPDPITGELKLTEKFNQRGIHYTLIEQIDHFWIDFSRPELYWRTFKEVSNFGKTDQAIYIYKRLD